MKTVTEKPEHAPSESHTLDEVLKSLQDLIRGELLDAEPRPPPPPKISHGKVGRPRKPRPEETAAAPTPAAETPVDIESVMRSLKALVSDELADVDETVADPTPADEPTVVDMTDAEAGATAAAAAPAEALPAHEPESESETPALPTGSQQELLLEAPATPELVPEPPTPSAEDIIRELESMVHEEARHRALAVPEAPNPVEGIDATPAAEAGLPEEFVLDSTLSSDDITLSLEDFDTPSPPAAAEPEPMPTPERAESRTVDLDSVEEIIGSDFLVGPDPGADPEVADLLPDAAPAREAPAAEAAAPETPPPAPAEPVPDEIVLEDELTLDAPLGEPEPPTAQTPPATAELDFELPAEPETTELALDDLLAPPAADEPQIEIAEQPAKTTAEAGDVPVLGESVNFDDLPILSDVVIPAPEPEPAPAETPKTAELPFGPPEQVRQLAIRVVAKLNIELRKAGERPLAARTIDRLQYILAEEIGRLGRETGHK